MFYTDDPVRDAERHDAAQCRRLDRLPVCAYCGEPIQEEYAYRDGDDLYHEECLLEQFRARTEDFTG